MLGLIGVIALAGAVGLLRLVGVVSLLSGLVGVVGLRGLPLALRVVESLGRLGHGAEGILLVSHGRYLLFRNVMLPV